MRILQVFDIFSPAGGGTVDLLYKLSRALAQRGHEVVIYASDYKLDQPYIDSLKGVKVNLFHCTSAFGGFFFTPGIVAAARDNLKSFDIIHIHAARSFQNIIIHHYARKYSVPYIMDEHGSLPRGVQGKRGFKWLLKWKFDIICGNRILQDAARVIAESEFGVREYQDFGVRRDKVAIIPLFFPVEDFALLPAPGRFRDRYGIKGKHIIMSLGRIHWIKGLDFLVAAFYALAKLRNDVILVIVGNDDGYKARLERQIETLRLADKVIFPGFLGGQEKLSALVDADIVVQPSRYEYAAWAPIEAVLCGTPVIVSAGSGSGEDISRLGAGELVVYGDKGRMVETMQAILGDPAKAREKVARARDYIKKNLCLSQRVEDYERLYRECLKNPNDKGE